MRRPDPHSYEAKLAAERRQALYNEVVQRLDQGVPDLPPGLSPEDVRDLKRLAGLAGNQRIVALCNEWF